MDAMKFFRRSLYFIGFIWLFFCLAGALLVYTYQDQLISRFITEANKRIDTPIHTSSIKASWWENFPDVSIVLNQVVIDGSLPGSGDTLATAENIYCSFNAWDIIRGRWIVDQIQMEQGTLFLVNTELGDNNFTIVAKDTTQTNRQAGFKLQKISLNEVAVTYLDLLKQQEYNLQVKEINTSVDSRGGSFLMDVKGELTSQKIVINEQHYFEDKELMVDGHIEFHQPARRWDISQAEITLDESSFLVDGYYQGNDSLEIEVEGHNTNIKTILSLLPPQIARKFSRYQSKGELYFAGRIKNGAAESDRLVVNVDFGCRNAFFTHPEFKKGIKGVYLTGNYYSPHASQLSAGTLTLKNVKGTMEGRGFSGNLTINNLEQYNVKGDFKGTFDLNSWQQFMPKGKVTDAQGEMEADITFDGPVYYLKAANSVDKFKATGEIMLKDLSFSLAKNSLPFENFNGHFLFNGRDLAISDFSGIVGNSDFKINGLFRNIIAFIFSKNQPIGIEADLQSQVLDLDELLTGNTIARDKTVMGKQTYTSFEINPRLALIFDCQVDELKFRRFRGRQIKGKLNISDQVAVGQQISFNTLGGGIIMNGRVDSRIKDHIRVYTKSSYQGIHLDSLFYVFENFGQDFLVDKHLKGQAFAEIDTYMAFDNHLRFKSPDLVVNAGLIIENGELNNFEPLQRLSTYLDSNDLKHLEFADLKNTVQIKNREIFLPDMMVQSNVTTIAVNGTHTFDQHINYRLKVPIKRSQKDKDEYFGAVEDDGLSTNLFLKIVGTTQEYQVVYDKEAVKNKIKQDLREEKWEFREAVRNKGADNTPQELDEEDFFDFEESDSTALFQAN